jgi:hypothetical protein
MIRDIDVETIANHIVGLANDHFLDQLLGQGSLNAVFLITDCPNLKEYLSFASKFCSWHDRGFLRCGFPPGMEVNHFIAETQSLFGGVFVGSPPFSRLVRKPKFPKLQRSSAR